MIALVSATFLGIHFYDRVPVHNRDGNRSGETYFFVLLIFSCMAIVHNSSFSNNKLARTAGWEIQPSLRRSQPLVSKLAYNGKSLKKRSSADVSDSCSCKEIQNYPPPKEVEEVEFAILLNMIILIAPITTIIVALNFMRQF